MPVDSRIINADFAARDIDDSDGGARVEVGPRGVGVEKDAGEGRGAGTERDRDCVRGLGDEAADLAEEGGGCDVDERGGRKGEGWRDGCCCCCDGQRCDED